MPGNGWISVYRKIKNNILWQDKPFSKGQAWIDLLLEVNHKKNKILFDNKVVEVEAGEKITSLRKLGESWGWSRTKVKNFLELLQNENMISYSSDNKKTVIKVLNYNDYQQSENKGNDTGVTQKRQSSDSEVTQKNTNNNDNNDNNDNNNIMSPKLEIENIYNSLSDYWKELFQDYIKIYKSKNKSGKITDSRHMKLLKEINQIYQEKKFEFDGKEYEITDKIFETGLNTIIEKNIDNLNYAKKVWIGQIERSNQNGKVSKAARRKEKRDEGEGQKVPDYDKFVQWG